MVAVCDDETNYLKRDEIFRDNDHDPRSGGLTTSSSCQIDYSTFSSSKASSSRHTQFFHRPSLCWTLFDHFSGLGTRRGKGRPDSSYFGKDTEQKHQYLTASTWKLIIFVSLGISLVAYIHYKGVEQKYNNFMPAEWHWDHNVYIPRENTGDPAVNHRDAQLSVIAQVVPGNALRLLEDISSRPNRAYARQWSLDFARYDAGRSSYSPRACFEKVAVLNAILDRQGNATGDLISLWPHSQRVRYDSILLLPPDAIITELDTNIIADILPSGKLVAIAGWSGHRKLDSNSDVIVFNLRHRHAEAAARAWLEIATPKKVTCGANNDLWMLVNAVAAVMDESEDLDDLIEPIPQTTDGFIGNRVMKSIPASVPGPRTAILFNYLQEYAALLQETADSVCYRFYPKCEVLTST